AGTARWRRGAEPAGRAERGRWQDEREALDTKGTEAKFTQLQAARGGLDSLRAEITQLEHEADAFPEEARRNPEEVKAEVAAARKDLDARNKELLDAQAGKRELDRLREQRGELGE